MSAPVTRFKSHVKYVFDVPAGPTVSAFLAAVAEGRLFGQRCPSCAKVYVPPRVACPRCGDALSPEQLPVSDTGTVTSFCVVNVPYEGQTMKLPYVYASVVLDGADIPFPHLVDAEPGDVRMGLRVRAEWRETRGPTLESIRAFKPTGEPDAPFDSFKEHL